MRRIQRRSSDHPKPDWQKADARVLGQLLAAQNIVSVLPDTTRIAEFYAQTLISVPGVSACRVCLGDRSVQAGELKSDACSACRGPTLTTKTDEPLPVVAHLKCALADQPDMFLLAIDSYQHHFGFFVFKVTSTPVFEVYWPFINNLSNYVAITLENRLQKSLLQKAHDDLELEVKERTRELTDSEARYRLLHENAGVGIGYYTPGGEVISYNHLAASHMQGKPEDFEGKSIYEIFPRADADVYMDRMRRASTSDAPIDFEDHLFLPSGEKWFLSTFARICDAQRTPIGVQIISQDITERKQAEEALRKLNQELEQRVAARTAQLEGANDELEAFAYSVSHDLRAPLRHISGFLALLTKRIESGLDGQSRHYIDAISGASTRMSSLIDDLLSFSRMSRREMARTEVDLTELVHEVIREFDPEAQGRDIHWQVAVLPEVTGDRALLRVVLVNLVSNALKFTQHRPRAEIEVGFTTETNETVFFVRDNGVGFDMKYVDRLFGVFQRLHRAEEFEGTGIGLASVRRIIARHGGRTWAHGEFDHGATIFFSLPNEETKSRLTVPATSSSMT